MEKQVLHIEKPKAVPVINSIGEENDRETAEQIAKQMEKNPNIDPTRTHLNRDLLDGIEHHLTMWERVQKRIKEGYTSDRKIRTDAVRVCDGIYGASSKFFAGMSNEEIYKFGNDFAEFLVQKVGRENIIGCRIHLDEKAGKENGKDLYAVHIHFQFVPLKDGKLARREFGISKHGLSQWHTECAKWMQSKGWQLERGEERQPWQEPVRHEQPNEYKRNHFSDKVPSVKLEKILHEIDGRVDISTSFFSDNETAKMDAKDYHRLRDIAGQVVSLRKKVEDLQKLEKQKEKSRARFKGMMDSMKAERQKLEDERAEVANKNEQAKYKQMQADLQDAIAKVKSKEKELERTLMQVKQNQQDAVTIAEGLIDKALNVPRNREPITTTLLDNGIDWLKKNRPKDYEQILAIGRKVSMESGAKKVQERNRRTAPQLGRQ